MNFHLAGGAKVLLTVAAVAALSTAGCEPRSEGEKLWRRHCAECHGVDGAGNNPVYSRYAGNDLLDDQWTDSTDPDNLEAVVLTGIFPTMPAFDHLSDAEIRAILDHLRELRGGR